MSTYTHQYQRPMPERGAAKRARGLGPEITDEAERPDRDDDVEREIQGALRQLAETRERKASGRASGAPTPRPKVSKAAGKARTLLMMVARTLRHFAQRLQLRAAVVPMQELRKAKSKSDPTNG